MKTAKRDEEKPSAHHRSVSRYSINRIQPAAKSPDVAVERTLKPSSSFMDLCANKENESSNYRPYQSNFQCVATARDRERKHLLQRGLENNVPAERSRTNYAPPPEDLNEMRKRHSSQLTEKDMIIMELKNTVRKSELEVKKREKVVGDLEKLVESKDKTIASLSAQNASLSSAVELLKSQEEQMQGLHTSASLECQSLKKQLAAKTADCRRLEEQLVKAHKDI